MKKEIEKDVFNPYDLRNITSLVWDGQKWQVETYTPKIKEKENPIEN